MSIMFNTAAGALQVHVEDNPEGEIVYLTRYDHDAKITEIIPLIPSQALLLGAALQWAGGDALSHSAKFFKEGLAA